VVINGIITAAGIMEGLC